MDFSKEELNLILDLCNKKVKGIDWVLKEKSEELKEDKKLDLEKKRESLQSIIDRIKTA